jgi:hypothetical protein
MVSIILMTRRSIAGEFLVVKKHQTASPRSRNDSARGVDEERRANSAHAESEKGAGKKTI